MEKLNEVELANVSGGLSVKGIVGTVALGITIYDAVSDFMEGWAEGAPK